MVGRAQVLRNSRGDGAPPIILATPPLESGAGLGGSAEAEEHAARMVGMAVDQWVSSEGPFDSSALCLVHIEASGLDFSDLSTIAGGLRKAFERYP
ncbi:hypothetical protein EDD30_3240 [Couchioplanes caeruleus]|uniref:Uncharacterized protein n=2 Tax=Couchioplanes caeruleus TaxID=56438 RepID=A0A1K0GJA9_9ACTN|nr:hypothetical protein BG844_28755 [Couchioplanes caeruleus subsp. caeruleus]ROP30395.1 hypothetical protein EDD30_3240 [Couchioplanes caeruleus]